MTTDKQKSAAAEAFATKWSGTGYEKGDTQKFWLELLQKVFGVEDPYSFVDFEDKVMVDNTNFMDVYLPATRVLIEQKSIDKNLGAPIHQSDGALLNPFQQAKKYIVGLPLSRHPRWVVTCNFAEFWVYDMEQPNGEPQKIMLKDLGKEYYRLQFLVDQKSEHISKEMQVSMQAGEIVGRIYDALLKQYDDASPEALRWLNILCVRIVFCLYAEDAGVFAHDQFHDYLVRYDAEDLRSALIRLFDTLNTPQDNRSKYLKEDLKAFPYTNGGLFAEEIEIPQFTDELKKTLLDNASLDFDWSEISPTIFGAVFESTLNPETRRSGGMHYTSIENIHKVIDPLFLNDLRHELDEILDEKVEKERKKKLDAYQDKLSKLTFLDPACGSGNFLTETYLSLRRLENEAIVARHHGQSFLGFEEANPIKVSINQFYGIEINDFAVTVATTALWISEAQMLRETEKIVQHDIDFLPLKSYSNIREGNALRMEWDVIEYPSSIPTIHAKNTYLILEEKPLVASEPTFEYGDINLVTSNIQPGPKTPEVKRYEVRYDYIMGNPPFIGASMMNDVQKQEATNVFGAGRLVNSIDYVGAWFYKAAEIICLNPKTRAAFVATNSITQGEQVFPLWNKILNKGIKIDFAYRTFRWDSESSLKAHVHCVIIGFSKRENEGEKKIYVEGTTGISATNINPYLYDAPDVLVSSRSTPLFDVPSITKGNQPTDNGNFILSEEERNKMIAEDSSISHLIHRYVGARDYLNNDEVRYCLWLKDVNPKEYYHNKEIMRRLDEIKAFREKSTAAPTRKTAMTPWKFFSCPHSNTNYLIIPRVSSERRRYIPIGFMSPDVIAADSCSIVPNASIYMFGVLTSNVHMSWMRVVGGRLKSDYRYSGGMVYNTFPWPKPTNEQKKLIEETAQSILKARNEYDATLAEMYGDHMYLYPKLIKAHQENDRAVMAAYGWKASSQFTESTCIAKLFELYKEITKQEK